MRIRRSPPKKPKLKKPPTPRAERPMMKAAATRETVKKHSSPVAKAATAPRSPRVGTALAIGGGAIGLGLGARVGLDGYSNVQESRRSRLSTGTTTIDTNGDGVPDKETPFSLVLNPDGSFSAFGASPNYSKDPAPSTLTDARETIKTGGLVLGGLLVVGGIVYLVTQPAAAARLAKAVRGK